MRTHSTIARAPRLWVAVLGGALAAASTFTVAPRAEAAPAQASSAPDAAKKKEARDAYAAGEKAYAAGDYAGAFDDFKKAHDLIPTIHARYWMAMSQSHGDDVSGSADALSAVLSSPDASKLGEEKMIAAKARLDELQKIPATVVVISTPAGATVLVDGKPQTGVTPVTLTLSAGAHHLTAVLKGYDAYDADLTAKPGQKLQQDAGLTASMPAAAVAPPPPATTPPPPAPPPAVESHSKLPGFITLGVGIAGAGVGTAFGIAALGAKSDFNKNPTTAGADKADRDALIADMGFAVALTLGITGIVLLTTGGDSSDTAAPAAATGHRLVRAKLDLAPLVTSTTGGATARLTF